MQDTNPPIALGADKVALMTLANSCLTYNSRSSTPCISSFPTTRNRFHNDSINRKSDRSQNHIASSAGEKLIAILNETKQMTTTVTQNIYLNLTTGNPLTTTDTAVITIASVLIGIAFGFFIGVSFTSIFAIIFAKLIKSL